MIMDFAKKKERQDVVDLTQGNLQIVLMWVKERGQLIDEELRKQFGADYDSKNPEPTQKQLEVLVKLFKPLVKDLKKIIVTLKKDPLKKINKSNILESVRTDRQNFLMERKLRARIRNILRNK